MRRAATIVGRGLLAPMFIINGAKAAMEPGKRVAVTENAGLPEPELLVRLNGAAMAVGGVALALGIKPRWASVLLAGCLVPTTAVGHAFWSADDPATREAQKIQFAKNVAMLGGLVLVHATGEPRSAST